MACSGGTLVLRIRVRHRHDKKFEMDPRLEPRPPYQEPLWGLRPVVPLQERGVDASETGVKLEGLLAKMPATSPAEQVGMAISRTHSGLHRKRIKWSADEVMRSQKHLEGVPSEDGLFLDFSNLNLFIFAACGEGGEAWAFITCV